MRLSQSFLTSLLVALLTACHHDDDGYLSPQTCQLECERIAQCSIPDDGRTCRDQCTYPSEPAPPPLTPRYLDAVRRCLATVPCNAAGFDSASDRCAYDAALSLMASKPAQDLCSRALRADGPCGVTLGGTCLDDVKIYDDEVLRRAARCYDHACADQSSCLELVFGYPYPYVRPYSRGPY